MFHDRRKTPLRIAAAISLFATLATLGVASVFAAAPPSVAVGTGSSPTLGTILTGPSGNTLYTLSSDPNNGSSCSGACATAWPPLLVAAGGSVTGPAGMSGFSTFTRADGTTQVAFNGRALYYFIKDTAAGMTNGDGIVAFGGTWHVVSAAAAGSSPSASVAASASPVSSVAGVTSAPGAASPPPTSTQPSDNGSGSSPSTGNPAGARRGKFASRARPDPSPDHSPLADRVSPLSGRRLRASPASCYAVRASRPNWAPAFCDPFLQQRITARQGRRMVRIA